MSKPLDPRAVAAAKSRERQDRSTEAKFKVREAANRSHFDSLGLAIGKITRSRDCEHGRAEHWKAKATSLKAEVRRLHERLGAAVERGCAFPAAIFSADYARLFPVVPVADAAGSSGGL